MQMSNMQMSKHADVRHADVRHAGIRHADVRHASVQTCNTSKLTISHNHLSRGLSGLLGLNYLQSREILSAQATVLWKC